MRRLPLLTLLVATAASAQVPPDAPRGRLDPRANQKIERTVIEDDSARIEELKVGGQTEKVTVQPKDVTNADGSTDHQVSLSYKPDPPDVQVTLKAPPGSAGAVIKAVDVVYVFNTQFRQSQGLPPLQIGPIRAPLPPIVVGPAQDIAFGPPAQITIPIGSSSLASVFNPLDASGRPDHDPTKQPGLIVANMEFIDDGGFAIQDKGFQNLQVSAVLRSL